MKKLGRPIKYTTPIQCRLVEAATRNAENSWKPLVQIAQEAGVMADEHTLRRIFEKERYGH